MEIKISRSQKQKIKKVAEKNGVLFAVVFGSAAKNQKRPESDLDIAVLTRKKPSYQLFKNLFSDFSEVFKGENVDLRFLNGADPFFRFQVVKNGQLLYGNQNQYQEYFTYAYKSFIDDAQPLLELQRKLIYQKQRKLEKAVL